MSNHTNLEEVYNAWQNNLQFRTAFNLNPEQALLNLGLKLNDADLKKVQTLLKSNKSKNDENNDLEKRINK